MLEHYIEKNISRKVAVLNVLLELNQVPIEELMNLTGQSETSLLQNITNLNEGFSDSFIIENKRRMLSLTQLHPFNRNTIIHGIYQESTMLHMLKYFLSEEQESFSAFLQEHFLSSSTGYRLREKCTRFLKEIGLRLHRNRVVGDEYRIRFLIALLQYKFGIILYEFTEAEMKTIVDFCIMSNINIARTTLEKTAEDYLLFSTLLLLAVRRQKFAVTVPPSRELTAIKQLFIYQTLCEMSEEILAPAFNIEFSQQDLEFIFLVYCTAHSPFAKERWQKSDMLQALDIVRNNTFMRSLRKKFESIFGPQVTNHPTFITALLFFMKPFICNLQGLIPNYYYKLQVDHLPKAGKLYKEINKLVKQWMSEEGIVGKAYEHHIYHLSIQIKEIIKATLDPVTILIFANNQADLNLLEQVFRNHISPKSAQILAFDFLSEPLPREQLAKRSIIIAERQCAEHLQPLLDRKHLFINCSVNLCEQHFQTIYEDIAIIKEENYQKYLAQLSFK